MLMWSYEILLLAYLLTFRNNKIILFKSVTEKSNFFAFRVTVVTLGEAIFELFTKNLVFTCRLRDCS